MRLRALADDTVAEAIGRKHRLDPVVPGSGGPAGNANLTAWTGLVLLVFFLVELATLLDLNAFLSWHIVVGVLLVPPALLKTGTTVWRVLGYYGRRPPYRRAGPPPLLLRVLGPLVVIFTLAVLGSGLALIAIGPEASLTPLVKVLGHSINTQALHQATFILWAVVTGLHALARLVPTMRIVTAGRETDNPVPGRVSRATAVTLTLLAAVIAAVIVLAASGPWLSADVHGGDHHQDPAATTSTPD